jgi:hypothetical protein
MSGYLEDLSESQSTALDNFRSNLANIYLGLNLQPEYQNLWGVPLLGIDETPTNAQKRVMLKFLRAREFDVEKALAMAESVLKWRQEFRINELMSEDYGEAFDKLGMVWKTDKKGCPVTWNFYAGIDTEKIFSEGVEKFIRWRVQLMEKAVVLLDFETPVETVTQLVGFSERARLLLSKVLIRDPLATSTSLD